MPRKTNPLPKAESQRSPERPEMPEPEPDEKPRKKGRARMREIEEEKRRAEEEERKRNQLDPKDTVVLSVAILKLAAMIIKADDPTQTEVNQVNEPLCLVFNKYGGRIKYLEETVLVLAVGSVLKDMKVRAVKKRKATDATSGDTGNSGAQGFGQNTIVEAPVIVGG